MKYVIVIMAMKKNTVMKIINNNVWKNNENQLM